MIENQTQLTPDEQRLVETFGPIESDPHGIDQHAPGAKLDAGKIMAGVLSDFPRALLAVAEVGTFGARKYSRGGWQSVSNGVERYGDAMWRHLLAERIDPTDADSGLPHAAQVAWNALARLELMLREGESVDYSPVTRPNSPETTPKATQVAQSLNRVLERNFRGGHG